MSLPRLGMVNVFNIRQPSKCVVVSHYGFNLQFPDD